MKAIALAIAIAGSIALAASAGATPARCATSKAKAAGRLLAGLARCEGDAIDAGKPVAPGCIASRQATCARAWQRAEARGGCGTTGDLAAITAKADALLDDVGDVLGLGGGPDSCAAAKLRAAGDAGWCALRCQARGEGRQGVPSTACLHTCADRFARRCAMAEGADNCRRTGDCGTIAARVDAHVANVVAELSAGTVPTPPCALSTTPSRNARAADHRPGNAPSITLMIRARPPQPAAPVPGLIAEAEVAPGRGGWCWCAPGWWRGWRC